MRRAWVVVFLFACDSGDGSGGDPTDAAANMADGAVTPDGATPDAAVGGECTEDQDCEGIAVCHEGRCVGCFGDDDCTEGFVCTDDFCVAGCRDDDTCAEGDICTDGACVGGCRNDEQCDTGTICEGDACVAGCRPGGPHLAGNCPNGQYCDDAGACQDGCVDDDDCGVGAVCEVNDCVEGCRDDDGCGADQLCLDEACVFRGVGCRTPEDCNEGDTCDDGTCVPDAAECPPDGREPNDVDAVALEAGSYPGLSVCPGDVDLFSVMLAVGETLTVRLDFADANGALGLMIEGRAAPAHENGDRVDGVHVAERDGAHTLRVAGVTPEVRSGYALTIAVEAPRMCVDATVYPDTDGDGYGEDDGAVEMCLEDEAAPDGFALAGGDCRPNDVLGHPNAPEICGDWLDDDCDGVDAECPESMPGMAVPEWDCVGAPPPSVYAWARFPDGGGYFQDGGCFYIFEGLPDEFYVTRRLERVAMDPSCFQINGCTCPSLNNWPSYDRRMYAFTLRGEVDECAELTLIDHGGEEQPVSNECRKYLYQMHFYDLPHSYVGRGLDVVGRRLELFPTVEVACVEDAPHRNLPYQSLLTAPIELNPNFERID